MEKHTSFGHDYRLSKRIHFLNRQKSLKGVSVVVFSAVSHVAVEF